jgi:LPXTG-site transpeptidase (sortase) family protein
VRRKLARAAVVAVAAGSLLAGGLALWLAAHSPPGRAVAGAPVHVVNPGNAHYQQAVPSPTPTPVSHTGVRIRIPQLGVDLPVVEGNGVDAPLFKAAHYPGTTWPGEGGRSVIYAHARVGMFGPLFGARVGQEVQVASANGAVKRFVIQQYYPRWPVTDLAWLRPGDHEQLVLITCTTYNNNDPRIIAVSEPV